MAGNRQRSNPRWSEKLVMSKYILSVYDREGGILNEDDTDEYDTELDANLAGEFWVDDPRYGSHEVESIGRNVWKHVL